MAGLERRARVAVAATFVVVLAVAQLAAGGRASRTASVTGDEPFYLLTTQSLASDGDLDLRDEYRGETDTFWDGTVPLWKQMAPMPDGRLLSPHEPGLSLLTLPGWVVAGKAGVQRQLAVLWAVTMAIAAAVALRLRVTPWAAAVGAIAVGAGPPGSIYASQVYPEVPAALAVAVLLLAAAGRRPRPLVVAAALVALPWLGPKYVVPGAAAGAMWLWRFRHDRRAVVIAAAVCAIAGVHLVWWHLRTFDGLTPYATNLVYAGAGSLEIVSKHVSVGDRGYRVYGLFLDARFGVLRWLPVTAVAAWGVARRTAMAVATLAAAVGVAAFVSITMMGWWFPGRMLVVALPALAVLVATGAQRVPRIAFVLGAWGIAVTAATAWSAHHGGIRLAVDPWQVGAPLPPHWLFPDFRSFGPGQMLHSAAWAAAIGLAVLATNRRRARPAGHRQGRQVAIAT